MMPFSKQQPKLRTLIDSWTAELEQLRCLLRDAQAVPREMRRHHSFVVESARMIEEFSSDMRGMLYETGSIAKDANSMLHVATSAHFALDGLLEACRDDAMAPHRSLVRNCVIECKQVVSLAFNIRNAMSSVCDQSTRLQAQLCERAAMIRAGAKAIHDNLNADDAEDHVRKLYIDVPHEWKRPWRAHEWLD